MADGAFDGQERSEKPTARKLARAREEGQTPRSADLSGAVVMTGGALLLAGAAGRAFAGVSRKVLETSWSALASPDLGTDGTVGVLRGAAGAVLGTWLPFAVAVVACAVLVGVLQVRGFIVTTGPVSPKLSHVNPLSGLKRILSPESLVTVLRSALKLGLIGAVMYWLLSRTIPSLLTLTEAAPSDTAIVMARLSFRFGIVLGIAYIVLGAADYLWQMFRTGQSLRMSRQEVVNEHKETEGNPHVKARIMGMARALARRRMLQNVPAADVVVVNPTHVAVALKYDPSLSPAPVVLAMGERKLAERIKALALKAGVPLVENRPVARALLATAKVGASIPPALYAAVAEILAFVYRKRKSAGIPLAAGVAADTAPSAAAGARRAANDRRTP